MKIRLIKLNSILGDLEGNYNKIAEHIESANNDVDLIVFPELSLTGNPPEYLIRKKYFVEEIKFYLKKIAELKKDLGVIVGYVRSENGKVFNSAALISNGKIKQNRDKSILSRCSIYDEKDYFSEGAPPEIFSFKNNNLLITIGDELNFNEYGHEGRVLQINISSAPFYIGKDREIKELLNEINNKDILSLNSVGAYDEIIFEGNIFIKTADKDTISLGKKFQEGTVDIEIDDKSRNVRTEQLEPADEQDIIEETIQALVLSLKRFIYDNGFTEVVIGLSGGIDSAVTAVLACKAIGSKNVHCLSMPTRFNSSETKRDSRVLAENLGCSFNEIQIDTLNETFLGKLEVIFSGLEKDLTEENLQARIRAVILMAASNKFNYLLLATGNKSEGLCGYCTLYGDTAGGFAVLKDIYKTDVYKIAAFLNRDSEVIPEDIIERAPSAELSVNQKDTDSLPEYGKLDRILELFMDKGMSPEKICKSQNLDCSLVKEVIKKVEASEFKRRQSPPGPVLSKNIVKRKSSIPIASFYNEKK